MCDAQDLDVLVKPLSSSQSRGLRLSVPIAVAVVLADQATKQWAVRRLMEGSCDVPDACVDLPLGARFHLAFNTGAAFETGSELGPLLGVLAFVMAIVLLAMSRARTDRLGTTLLGSVAGGAVGNLIDRIVRADDGILSGAVIDFIDFGWWPIFNIADSAIVMGVIGLIVATFFETRLEAEESDLATGYLAADDESISEIADNKTEDGELTEDLEGQEQIASDGE